MSIQNSDQVSELELLLPTQQVMALEMQAEENGVTTGQLLRQIISAFVERSSSQPSHSIVGRN